MIRVQNQRVPAGHATGGHSSVATIYYIVIYISNFHTQ